MTLTAGPAVGDEESRGCDAACGWDWQDADVPPPPGTPLEYAAAWYCRYGMAIVPLVDKNPSRFGADWWARAITDPLEALQEFSDFRFTNIGWAQGYGTVAIDIDHPDRLTDEISAVVNTGAVNETRPGRRHRIFATEQSFSGSTSGFPAQGWGEVRAGGGQVVIWGPHPDDGSCHYAFDPRPGIPPAPPALIEWLTPRGAYEGTATSEEVRRFLDEHTESLNPSAMSAVFAKADERIAKGESLHETTVRHVAPWLLREVRAGIYSGADAEQALGQWWDRQWQQRAGRPANPNGEPQRTRPNEGELDGILRWALARAMEASDEAIATVRSKLAPLTADLHRLAAASPNGASVGPGDPTDSETQEFRNPATGEPITAEMAALIDQAVQRKDVLEAAEAIIADRTYEPLPPALTMQEALDQAPEPQPQRIECILAADYRAILTAPKKMGKTTLVTNVVRAVTTGGMLFDRWRCRQGRVLVLNYEVLPEQFAIWCDEAGVPLDAAHVMSFRGCANPLVSRRGRLELATRIADLGIDLLVIDPYGAAISGIVDNENDNAQARGFLSTVDEVIAEAGVSELLMTAHAGKHGDDGRGASALEDWPDAIWRLVGDDSGNRFFSALGRDIDVQEQMLQYDHANRRLRFTAQPATRATAAFHRAAEVTFKHLAEHPGANIAEIKAVLTAEGVPGASKSGAVGEWLKRLVQEGHLVQVTGPNNSKLHYLPGQAGQELGS